MPLRKDPELPDGSGSSDGDSIYESSLMDTEDISLIIKKVPNTSINKRNFNFQTHPDIAVLHTHLEIDNFFRQWVLRQSSSVLSKRIHRYKIRLNLFQQR